VLTLVGGAIVLAARLLAIRAEAAVSVDESPPPDSVLACLGAWVHDGYDLHTHSTCSTRTNTITENVKLALERGLTGIAITDHDTTEGLRGGLGRRRCRSRVVTGIEFSAE